MSLTRAFAAQPGLIGFGRNKSLLASLAPPVPRSQLDPSRAGFSHPSEQQNGFGVNFVVFKCPKGILRSQDKEKWLQSETGEVQMRYEGEIFA